MNKELELRQGDFLEVNFNIGKSNAISNGSPGIK